MKRSMWLVAGLLLLAPASLGAAELSVESARARYLAQRYALAGFIAEASGLASTASAAPARCVPVVTLRTRGGDIPVCESAPRRPAQVAARLEVLLAQARHAVGGAALALLREAVALEPFSLRASMALAAALRVDGKAHEARTVEAKAAELAAGRPVVWAAK